MKTTKGDRHARATKADRRARRKAKDGHGREDGLSMRVLGGVMDRELFDRVLAAAQSLDLEAPWPDIASLVLPILRRVHHPYPPEAAPMHIFVPPGVWTGFGIDFGPAFTHVTARQVERWGIDQATLLGTALENLRALTVVEPPRVERIRPEGVETIAVQGQGWGSALILVPEVLRPILGDVPRVLLAPVRNTLVALPEDVEPEMAFRMWDAIAEGCHDELDLNLLRWTGTTVVADGDDTLGLPN
ncbi:MAG TPA: hypothetical protein VM408_02920 [Methylomirabilota bacterium]|nr:hypothetical protein [Methylomirabilota bacterium]